MIKLILALLEERGHNGVRYATKAHSPQGWATTENRQACKFDAFGFGDSDYKAIEELSTAPLATVEEIARHIAPNRGTHPVEWRTPLTSAEKALASALGRRTQV